MTEDEFWEIIACFDWGKTGDDDAVTAPALRRLVDLSTEAIYAFDDMLAERLFALDTREHCRAGYLGELDPDNGDDYVSADDFLYLRCVVVANGREFYENVRRDPTRMPRGLEFEALLDLPARAYEDKTGSDYDHVAPVSFESFSNADGWRGVSDTRPGKFTGDNVPPLNRRPS